MVCNLVVLRIIEYKMYKNHRINYNIVISHYCVNIKELISELIYCQLLVTVVDWEINLDKRTF